VDEKRFALTVCQSENWFSRFVFSFNFGPNYPGKT